MILFSTAITSPNCFRTFVKNLLHHKSIPVQPQRDPKKTEFTGLKAAILSDGKDILTTARFSCAIRGDFLKPFLLDTAVCNEFLKQVDGDSVLHLDCIGDSHSNASCLRLWHECNGIERFEMRCAMPTLPYSSPAIRPIKSAYVVNASVGVLRRLQKLCKTLRSSKFTFVINESENKKKKGVVVTFEFKSADGRSKVSRIFGEDSSDVGKELHRSSVAHSTLVSFIRNMDRDSSITIGLGEGIPVVLNYDLGTPGSFIRCVSATL